VVAYSSYEIAIESWYDAHSAQLSALAASCTVSISGSGSSGSVTGTYSFPSMSVLPMSVCSGGSLVSAKPGSTAGSTSAKTTGGSSTTTGSGPGSGSVSSSSKSAGGAAPTGAVTFGAAGVVGLLGLLVAL
jgi:hypothetical protein